MKATEPSTRWPDPRQSAIAFSKVAEDNYLAHSIREIEKDIVRYRGRHYPITLATGDLCDDFVVYFAADCCEIRMPVDLEDKKGQEVRLSIAHELAHIVYNFDHLPRRSDSLARLDGKLRMLNEKPYSTEEEIYSWKFAYHLIWEKSEDFIEHDGHRVAIVCGKPELKDNVIFLARRSSKKIGEAVEDYLITNG